MVEQRERKEQVSNPVRNGKQETGKETTERSGVELCTRQRQNGNEIGNETDLVRTVSINGTAEYRSRKERNSIRGERDQNLKVRTDWSEKRRRLYL
jgi:hypothetical protein